MRIGVLVLASVLLSLLPLAPLVSSQQVSEQEAYQAFLEAGCTECHDGSSAPDWNGTIATIQEWAAMYASIDEAVQYEYTFQGGADSYDEMMQAMRDLTGSVTDEQYQLLYNFFLQVFQAARAEAEQTQTTTTPAPGECTGETVTVTVTTTLTRTKTVTETITEVVRETVEKEVLVTVPVEQPQAREAPTTLSYAPLVAGALSILGLAYLYIALHRSLR